MQSPTNKTSTIPVALVNGVYFPTQRLRFKVNDPSRQIFNLKDGFYGIITKKSNKEDNHINQSDNNEVPVQEEKASNLSKV